MELEDPREARMKAMQAEQAGKKASTRRNKAPAAAGPSSDGGGGQPGSSVQHAAAAAPASAAAWRGMRDAAPEAVRVREIFEPMIGREYMVQAVRRAGPQAMLFDAMADELRGRLLERRRG